MTDVSRHVQRLGLGSLPGYVQRAPVAIDLVHSDGGLSIIRVDEKTMFGIEQARYYHRHNLIEIDPTRPELEFAFIHELGHAIDFSLGRGRMASFDASELEGWRLATFRSRSYRRLLDFLVGAASHVESELASYLLHTDGTWARAYTQYIAIRSSDRVLMGELSGRQGREAGELQAQWDDDDFAETASTIDDYLRMLS